MDEIHLVDCGIANFPIDAHAVPPSVLLRILIFELLAIILPLEGYWDEFDCGQVSKVVNTSKTYPYRIVSFLQAFANNI